MPIVARTWIGVFPDAADVQLGVTLAPRALPPIAVGDRVTLAAVAAVTGQTMWRGDIATAKRKARAAGVAQGARWAEYECILVDDLTARAYFRREA